MLKRCFFAAVAVLFLVLLPAGADAQEAVTLTVDEAVKQAIANSRTLKSAAIDLEITKRTRDTVWGNFFPNLSVNGALSRQNKYTDTMGSFLGSPGLPSMPPARQATEADHWSAAGTVSASLPFTAMLVNSIRSAYAGYEGGLITWEQVMRQTERDVRKMFYSILFMQENLKLQKNLLENARQRWIQAQVNYRNGLVPELTVLQAQVAYESKKPIILELEQNISQQLSMFGFLLGYKYGTQIILDGIIKPEYHTLNAKELIDEYAAGNLSVLSLQKNIRVMQLQISASKAGTYIPSITFSYSLSPALSPINNSWLKGSNWNDRGSLAVTLAWNLTNLLPFSQNMVGIKNRENNLEQMRINLDSVTENTEMEINNLVNKMDKSQSSIEVQKLNITVAQKAYNLTLEGFNAGTKELLDVRDAESQLNQAQIGVLQEELNYIISLLDLEYAINTKFSGI